jgi:hypothetical protein
MTFLSPLVLNFDFGLRCEHYMESGCSVSRCDCLDAYYWHPRSEMERCAYFDFCFLTPLVSGVSIHRHRDALWWFADFTLTAIVRIIAANYCAISFFCIEGICVCVVRASPFSTLSHLVLDSPVPIWFCYNLAACALLYTFRLRYADMCIRSLTVDVNLHSLFEARTHA